ncbi:Uncharacterised protein [Burkholderia pseudomallei]|nr:Uncharacterised protein [Burkholderia pseudomallei]VBR25581.1 Uncharacterised protein [Burkholderia pseudomallei]VBU10009.1 Uncharacterised protein [Burkholderia pseudomallei]
MARGIGCVARPNASLRCAFGVEKPGRWRMRRAGEESRRAGSRESRDAGRGAAKIPFRGQTTGLEARRTTSAGAVVATGLARWLYECGIAQLVMRMSGHDVGAHLMGHRQISKQIQPSRNVMPGHFPALCNSTTSSDTHLRTAKAAGLVGRVFGQHKLAGRLICGSIIRLAGGRYSDSRADNTEAGMITYASGRSKLPHWPINSPCRQRGREDRFSYAPKKANSPVSDHHLLLSCLPCNGGFATIEIPVALIFECAID